jgi:hypothetical protein
MKPKLDMEKIAQGLRAERRGAVAAGGGHFGALQVAAEVQARFRTPVRGGRSTDPSWTERRLVPLAPKTLHKLEHLSAKLRHDQGISIEPLQLAGLLLEWAAEGIEEITAGQLARSRRG